MGKKKDHLWTPLNRPLPERLPPNPPTPRARGRGGSGGGPARGPAHPLGPEEHGPPAGDSKDNFRSLQRGEKETSLARLLLSSLRLNKSAPPGLGLNVAHWIINSIFPALL